MKGARGAVILGLLVTMLTASVDCMPSRRPLPRGHLSGTSRATTQPRQHSDERASDEAFGVVLGVGQFLLDLLLSRAVNGGGGSQDPYSNTAPYQTARGQLAVVEQGSDQEDQFMLDVLADELWREYTAQQNPTNHPTAATRQGNNRGKATTQFRSLWNNIRGCVSDIFSPDSGDMPPQQQRAVMSEIMSVWTGQRSLSQASAQVRVNWDTIQSCIDRFGNQNQPSEAPSQANINWWPFSACNTVLYVMAFTGDSPNSRTSDQHLLELTVAGEVRQVALPVVTGLEFQRNKGDKWAFALGDFGFTETCIGNWDVDGIAIVEDGTDGWLINSVVTLLQDDDGYVSLLSSDIDVDAWIDGNGGEERKRFDLTIDY